MSPPRLHHRELPAAEVLVRGAHVLDPRSGCDERHDVLVRGGMIAELAAPETLPAPEGATTIEARGRHLFPGFVDPHVHLRTPGQEYKEDLDTGTAGAAAGGYCAVVAMPNTNPTVDSAAVLGSLQQRAGLEARVPVGFLASITRGLAGEELTEMAELRDAGAIGFTDDGKPVVSAGMLRRALQYQRLAGGIIALHEEDPALSRRRGHARGRGLGPARAGRDPVAVGVDDGRPRRRPGRLRGRPRALPTSLLRRVGAGAGRRQGGRGPGQRRGLPHHLTLTDDVVRTLDSRFKMNPPLRAEADRRALVEALSSGVIDCVATDHAPHAATRRRSRSSRRRWGRPGWRRAFAALYTELVLPGSSSSTRSSPG